MKANIKDRSEGCPIGIISHKEMIMKNVLLAVLAMLVSATSLADQAQTQNPQQGDQAQKFQEHKQHMLDRMDQRIAALQKARGCVAQAQNKDAVKACLPEHGQGGHDRDHHNRDKGNS
ncbi:MAG: hypothetical protein ACHP6J_06840 [Burkholderiales bacterium]